MTQTQRPEASLGVTAFVDRVRGRLTDLTDEEREELVGGLEGDLSELVADGGSLDDLDPTAYAEELRAAAGLTRSRRRSGGRAMQWPTNAVVGARLDVARERWDEQVASKPVLAAAWELAKALRPAWWVLRAWLAVQLVDIAFGPGEQPTLVPSLGAPMVGTVVLAVAVVLSVQLGRGRVWPQLDLTTGWSRLVLAALNCLAVAALLPVTDSFPDAYDAHHPWWNSVGAPPEGPGLRSSGHYVRNIFAYDAQGRPLTGVQLYDGRGRPLAVTQVGGYASYLSGGTEVTTYPWYNGSQPLYNVFPLPVRQQRGFSRVRDAWATARPPVLPAAPLAVVPPVALRPLSSGAPSSTPSSAGPSAGSSAGPSSRSSATPRPSARAGRTPSARPTHRAAQRSPAAGRATANSGKAGRG